MNKELIIVFVKNILLGKVKIILAKTIGDEGAFNIYSELVKITETETTKVDTDRRIYFSDAIINSKWPKDSKYVQEGSNLGERMKNAFIEAFNDDYEKVVLIGSDLPDISKHIIAQGLDALKKHDVVFGPAEDGGYYLIGLTKPYYQVFDNKPWSQPNLLETTLNDLKNQNIKFTLLQTLNDIDTFEDLKASNLYNILRQYTPENDKTNK